MSRPHRCRPTEFEPARGPDLDQDASRFRRTADALAPARAVDGDDGDRADLAQYRRAGPAQSQRRVRRRSRYGPIGGFAVSCRTGGGPAADGPAVRPFRPTPGGARRARLDQRREPGRGRHTGRRDVHPGPHAAGDRRRHRRCHRPRHHSRPVRSRSIGGDDRPRRHRHGGRADDLAADRRNSRDRLRLAIDFRVPDNGDVGRSRLGGGDAAGNAQPASQS